MGAEAIAGRVPLAVTVAEASGGRQVGFVRAAEALGADWVILQPPAAAAGRRKTALLRFVGAVAEASDLPVGIQNAAAYLGVGSLPRGARRRSSPTIPTCGCSRARRRRTCERLVEDTDGEFRCSTAAAAWSCRTAARRLRRHIPAPECVDVQVRDLRACAARRRRGGGRAPLPQHPAADRLHHAARSRRSSATASASWRAVWASGDVFDRAPAQHPTEFGLLLSQRLSAALPPW